MEIIGNGKLFVHFEFTPGPESEDQWCWIQPVVYGCMVGYGTDGRKKSSNSPE